jgi:DNA repair protein RecO (recombination protein O)
MVIGRRPIGESDRLVTFYTREFGKLSGVAKGARRPRSRFGSALELFTLGQLVFFESARSELVRVDHFDSLRSFVSVWEDLDRLGHGAWVVESVGRLSADRDPHAALYGLLVRTLRALEGPTKPSRAVLCFALRAVDLLGHRPRLDRCLVCGRVPDGAAQLDSAEGGINCLGCAPAAQGGVVLSRAAREGLRRLRTLRWDEALAASIPQALAGEMRKALEAYVVRLIGYPSRASRFLSQTSTALADLQRM